MTFTFKLVQKKFYVERENKCTEIFILNLDGGLTNPWVSSTFRPPSESAGQFSAARDRLLRPHLGLRHWLLLFRGLEKAHL